jgi:hypothetical protein
MRLAALLMMATGSIIGCGRVPPQPVGQVGAVCFRDATGVDLPDGAECLSAKTVTVAFGGDTHYLKIAAAKGISDFLGANFERAAWPVVERHLVPPEDWKEDLPFWSEADIARADIYYSKTFASPKGTFLSAIAYNKAAETVYVVASQLRE